MRRVAVHKCNAAGEEEELNGSRRSKQVKMAHHHADDCVATQRIYPVEPLHSLPPVATPASYYSRAIWLTLWLHSGSVPPTRAVLHPDLPNVMV